MVSIQISAAVSGGPSLFGLPMRQFSLLGLIFQNSLLMVILHYTRVMTPPGDHRYFASTAVFLNEVIKLAISFTFAIGEVSTTLAPQTPATVIFEQIYNSVFSADGWKLALPAVLYTAQNSLMYVALENLDAVHFQILYQLKILTTAFFTVVMLKRPLSSKRWMSLILLMVGVSIVSLPSSSSDSAALPIHDFSDHFFPRSMHELGTAAGSVVEVAHHLTRRAVAEVAEKFTKRSASYQGIQEDQGLLAKNMDYTIGLGAVLIATGLSGFTGVFFEKVLKESPTQSSVWTRNIQLSFYSLFPSLIVGVMYKDGADILKHGFFDGYTWVVWAAIILQSVGGILTSLCIQYADNIAKNYATSISIVVSFFISVLFFDLKVTLTFLLGTATVLGSTFLYSGTEGQTRRPPPVRIASFEKAAVIPISRTNSHTNMYLDPMDSMRTGLSTSRPSSPLRTHSRASSARGRSRDD